MPHASDDRKRANKVRKDDWDCIEVVEELMWHCCFLLGEFIPVEEPKEDKTKKRTVQEDGDGDGSDEDDDRIDMSAITGAKEREERREQFYAVQREGNTGDLTLDPLEKTENT